jgi:hypothetical protein
MGKVAMRDNERPTRLTRRQVLASGVAVAGAISFPSITRATAAPEMRASNLRLTAGTRTLARAGIYVRRKEASHPMVIRAALRSS